MEIRLEGIRKAYGNTLVLNDITLTLKARAFTTLLGPSGCGKTTLLRIIAGLETPDAGAVFIGERCVFSKKNALNIPPEKRGLGFVFQDFSLWPHMNVFENVAFGLRVRNKVEELEDRVREALQAVQLNGFERRFPHQLSGGQQQRVGFARALAVNPGCILFDEPFSALDAILREDMRAELKALVATRNMTSVFVTHDQHEAMGLSDEIVVMRGGVICQHDTPESIYNAPAEPFVARFVGRSDWLDDATMIRPEHVLLYSTPNTSSFPMRVISSQFTGGGYELTLSNGATNWIVFSHKRYAPEESICVYVDPARTLRFSPSATPSESRAAYPNPKELVYA